MSTDTPVRRRPRTPGEDQHRSFRVPDVDWFAALAACRARKVTLASELVAACKILAAGGSFLEGSPGDSASEHQSRMNLPGNMHPGPLERCQVPGCGPE